MKIPLSRGQDAAASLNGLSPRRRNQRRGFELMKIAGSRARTAGAVSDRRNRRRRIGATLTLT